VGVISEERDIKVLEEKLLSNAEAYRLLKKAVDRIMESEGSIPMLLSKTLDYLSNFSKIDPESAPALRSVLEKYGLKQESVIMIMNICPENVDELRQILSLEEKVFETETLNEILETIKPYCKK